MINWMKRRIERSRARCQRAARALRRAPRPGLRRAVTIKLDPNARWTPLRDVAKQG